MPMFIAGALVPYLATASIVGAIGPIGDDVAPSIGFGPRRHHHDWPTFAKTRSDALRRMGNSSSGHDGMQGNLSQVMRGLAHVLTLTDQEVADGVAEGVHLKDGERFHVDPNVKAIVERDHPGEFDRLVASGHEPCSASGECLDPLITDGSVYFAHHEAPMRPGDVVNVTASGVPMVLTKVYLGCDWRNVYLYSFEPSVIGSYPLAAVTNVDRVTHVKLPGKPLREMAEAEALEHLPDAAMAIVHRCGDMNASLPKAGSSFLGWDKALTATYEALKALPA